MSEEKRTVKFKGDSKVMSYVGIGLMLLSFVLAVIITNATGSECFTENVLCTRHCA